VSVVKPLQAAVAVITAISAAASTLAATLAGHSHRGRFDNHCDGGYARIERYPAIATVLLAVATLSGAGATAAATEAVPLYIEVGNVARAPIGWVEFCASHLAECAVVTSAPRDIVLTPKAIEDLVSVNRYVNEAVKPMTDLDHWGTVEKWSYPDDGYGDCEDYVLLKRRMLIQVGWPRAALLITVVRDHNDEGHAVLTVKTDRGEFILDNQAEDILPWFETGYRFVKRQSQSDPNVWVSLGGAYRRRSPASPGTQ
jgi:predicted transglutaminase-like cysteine proteinase